MTFFLVFTSGRNLKFSYMPMLSFLVWVSLAGCNFPYLSMLFIHSPSPMGGTKDPQPTPSQSTFFVKHTKLKCMTTARSSSTRPAHSVIGKQQSLTQWAHSRNISKVSRNNSIDLLFHTRHLVSPPSPGNELSVSAYMWVGVYTGTISVIYPGISGCLHREWMFGIYPKRAGFRTDRFAGNG